MFTANTHVHEIKAYASKFKSSKYTFDTSGHLPSTIYEDMDDQ